MFTRVYFRIWDQYEDVCRKSFCKKDFFWFRLLTPIHFIQNLFAYNFGMYKTYTRFFQIKVLYGILFTYVMSWVTAIIFADVAHEWCIGTLCLETCKLNEMSRVMNTVRYLTRFLWQRHTSMTCQCACGMYSLGAFETEIGSTSHTVDHRRVLFMFIAHNGRLQKLRLKNNI